MLDLTPQLLMGNCCASQANVPHGTIPIEVPTKRVPPFEIYVGPRQSVQKKALAERYNLPEEQVQAILAHCEGETSADCVCFAYCLTGYALELALKISTDAAFDKPAVLRL